LSPLKSAIQDAGKVHLTYYLEKWWLCLSDKNGHDYEL